MYQVKDGGSEWTGRFVSQAHAESRGEGVGAGRWRRQVIPSYGISVIELSCGSNPCTQTPIGKKIHLGKPDRLSSLPIPPGVYCALNEIAG